jgi:hypothetical protein
LLKGEFTSTDEQYALAHAYVPEHIPALMATISHAVSFLVEDYLGFTKDNWVIFVGYPLVNRFDSARCNEIVAQIVATYHPEYLWFIGPEIPPALAQSCRARQTDRYYRLDLAPTPIKASLQREVNQAAKTLTVERTRAWTKEHQALTDELMRREKLPPLIAELYRAMPEYVARCETACVLNARDARGKLSAFFVVELAAEPFDTYVLGCHSKKNYTPHASDLLFAEMIALACERGKPAINLGLGVNAGITRFKTKWGGVPYLKYEFCECYSGSQGRVSIVDLLLGEKL